VTPGFGVACVPEDVASIAAALRWLLEHPRARREMGEAGRRRVRDEWHYERQFASVLQLVTGQPASDPARVMAAAGV
jgi:glycosyltransferase involved in cell wall biosynthesis